MAQCLEGQKKQREAVVMWERSRELRGNAQGAEQLRRVFRERGWAAYWRERLKKAGAGEAAVHVRLGDLENALRKLRSAAFGSRFQALRRRAGYSDEMNTRLRASRPPLPPASVNESTR